MAIFEAMRWQFTAIIILIFCSASTAQEITKKRILTFDFRLVVDNDVFTLDLTKDQYYSSGIYPGVRWLADSGQRAKIIHTVKLNHRIYTPSWVGWNRQEQLDRPYAGQFSASFSNEYYFFTDRYMKLEMELGWMGPGSLVGKTQVTWHKILGLPEPRGWDFQINDTPILNAYLTYDHPFVSTPVFDILSESNVALGTVFNFVRQEIVFRAGKKKPLHQSAYVGGTLGNVRQLRPVYPSTTETYFFYAPGLEYVIYNASIEGNLIGKRSLYTDEAIRWVWQHRAGLMFSWPRFDLGIIAYWRTHENRKAQNHNYVGIRLNQRF